MSTLRDFDLQSRSVVNLGEDWKKRHAAVRKVWKAEDVISQANAAIKQGRELYDYFRAHGEFPEPDRSLQGGGNYAYFVELTAQLVAVGRTIEDCVSVLESEGYSVSGLEELRSGLESLDAIVAEDRLATDAAWSCGDLDE